MNPAYERFHIMDVNIDDEASGREGLDVSVYVDTHEKINVQLGSSMTIRTDLNGLMDLRDIFHRAAVKLDEVHSYNKTCEKLDRMTEEMNPPRGNKGEGGMSDNQSVDVFDMNLSNDPLQW